MTPDPIRLFHITAIDNLETICGAGELICKSAGTPEQAMEKINNWNKRKRDLIKPEHVSIAWQRLSEQDWISERFV